MRAILRCGLSTTGGILAGLAIGNLIFSGTFDGRLLMASFLFLGAGILLCAHRLE